MWKLTVCFEHMPTLGKFVYLNRAISINLVWVDNGVPRPIEPTPHVVDKGVPAQDIKPTSFHPKPHEPDPLRVIGSGGFFAYQEGETQDQNPYPSGSREAAAWDKGWQRAADSEDE